VSDGTHTASIALLGNYSLANFTASSDGHGGTSVVDPPLGGGNTPAEYLAKDPSDLQGALNQQMALWGQYMASAFIPSAFGIGSPSRVGQSEWGGPSHLAQPVATQHHA
jgi:hypothetical protein